MKPADSKVVASWNTWRHAAKLTWKAGTQTIFTCDLPAGITVKRIEAAMFSDLGGRFVIELWVPPIHLERNPRGHLAARLRKVLRGLAELDRGPRKVSATLSAEPVATVPDALHGPDAIVYLDDAADRLKMLHAAGVRAHYGNA